MTTSVVVKARAWGAKVDFRKADNAVESFELNAHEDGTYHLGEGDILTVQQGEKPADELEEPINTGGKASPVTAEQFAKATGSGNAQPTAATKPATD